jgi:penicillin amidase
MDSETTRRAVLGTLLGGGVVAGLGDPTGYLSRFAPFSGGFWETAHRDLPENVDSDYGPATLRYDDEGVAHVEGESEQAAAFAVGFAQGADRLFQMDLQRRVMRGELSAVFGGRALSSDRFHVQMDFAGAAEATWAELGGTDTAAVVEAFSYEPDPWTPVDCMLAEKQISWGLTGSFRTLRKETLAAAMGEDVAETLLPDRLDHDAPIIRPTEGNQQPSRAPEWTEASDPGRAPRATDPDLERWLSGFESPPEVGSNSWVVSGDLTDSGAPTMANDPHLSLMAPPVWYEMSVHAPDLDVRGVTFPGVPFVVIGENAAGAWGFTNAGADVIDFYEYEFRGEGEDRQYRYGSNWRDVQTETRTIAVSDGDDQDVEVRKTEHGALLGAESDGDDLRTEFAVAWTGLAATRTTESVRAMNYASGTAEFEAALRQFDLPTQNCVWAGRDGGTLYRVTGKVPIRRTKGEEVPGNRVFDGSEMEGEWPGYVPYGATSWDGQTSGGPGFIPFEEMPAVENPDYLGTANQRIVNDDAYPYYFAEAYSDPFRGIRLWDRLDRHIASGDPVDTAFMAALHDDSYDVRAHLFVPTMQEARDALSTAGKAALDELADWSDWMTRDSRAALVFSRFLPRYREELFDARFEEAGLGERRDLSEYYPPDWVLVDLDPDSGWFPEGRPAKIAAALEAALADIDEAGWGVYGDYNVTAIDHPFDRSWLNYPRYPTDGSEATLNNFRRASHGSSWRQICPQSGEISRSILPGGNDGSFFSDHYSDQLERWANTEYKEMPLGPEGDVVVEFGGDA